MNLGLGFVFLAGVVSFLSPCVLSMIPIYLGILGAATGTEITLESPKPNLFISGLFFILGFTIIFISLGFSASIVGNYLYFLKPWIARLGGFFIFVYGIHLAGLIHIGIFDFEWKAQFKAKNQNHYVNAGLMGIFFSAGWSPCIGPVLGAILTILASGHSTPLQGALFLFVYSGGIGLPFLLAAFGFQTWFKQIIRKPTLVRRIQQISGVLLSIMGVLLMLGFISRLAQFAPKWLL